MEPQAAAPSSVVHPVLLTAPAAVTDGTAASAHAAPTAVAASAVAAGGYFESTDFAHQLPA